MTHWCRIAGLVAALAAGWASLAWAGSDDTVHQFFLPGTNTSGYRVHTTSLASEMSVTIRDKIIATGGYKVAYTFSHTGRIVAGSSNATMPIAGTAGERVGTTAPGVLYQRTPTAGSIIGVVLSSSAALTANAAHAEAIRFTPGGSVERLGFTTVIGASLSQTQYSAATQARGLDTFTSSQMVGCQTTADAGVLPLTAELACTIITEQ